MDDLIQRQAVLDYFFRPYSNEESYSNIDIARIIKALPSVKPQEPSRDMEEIEEVINCDADAEIKLKMISNIAHSKPHYFKTSEQEPCEDAVSRDAVLEKAVYTETEEGWCGYTVDVDYIKSLPSVNPQEPSEDVVSRGVFEQVMWERDVAIEQLKDLGYGLGEKPKTGHWKHTAVSDVVYCDICDKITHEETRFCPNCGIKMVEPQESEDKG